MRGGDILIEGVGGEVERRQLGASLWPAFLFSFLFLVFFSIVSRLFYIAIMAPLLICICQILACAMRVEGKRKKGIANQGFYVDSPWLSKYVRWLFLSRG